MTHTAHRDWKAALLLGVGASLLLAALNAGHSFGTDGAAYFRMSESLVTRGWIDVPPPDLDPNMRGGSFSPDGRHYYAPFTYGHALYLVPWQVFGRILGPMMVTNYGPAFFIWFAHTLTTGATYGLLCWLLMGVGLRPSVAYLVSFWGLFSGLGFPYARQLYSEPLLGLVMAALWWCVAGIVDDDALDGLQSAVGKHWPRLLWIVFFSAYALAIRPPALVALPGFWLLARPWRQEEARWRTAAIVTGTALFVGIGLGGNSVAAYNYTRYGSLFSTGYETLPNGDPRGFTNPLWHGLVVFLASPGKSLFLFAPLLVGSILGIRDLARHRPAKAGFVLWVFASNLVLYSLWCRPEGGYTWGPRFFVPFLPMLLLPCAWWLEHGAWKWRRSLFAGLVAGGLAIQLLGVSVNFAGVIRDDDLSPTAPLAKRYYSPIKRRYNLWFEPFTLHARYLGERLSPPGSLLAVRTPQERLMSYQVVIVNDPLWDDCPDFWPLHLIKDGFAPAPVIASWLLLASSGGVCCWLGWRRGSAADQPADPDSSRVF